MPKELLEAKKLELIQEKVRGYAGRSKTHPDTITSRSMPKKLRKKRVIARNRSEFVTVTLTAFVKEKGVSVVVAVGAVAEEVEISIDVHLDTQDPRLQEEEVLLFATITEDHLPGEKWIHTSLAVVAIVVEMREHVARDQHPAQFPAPDLDRRHPLAVGTATTSHQYPPDAETLLANPAHHPPDDEVPEEEKEGLQIVVITEQDP